MLDLTEDVAGAVAGMLLADNGARVIKVEPAAGSPERSEPGHRVWDRGKESVVLDPRDVADRPALERLLARADVLLHGFTAARERALALDHERLTQMNPRLVTCAVTGYGPDGPLAERPWREALVSARTGRAAGQYGWLPGPSHVALPVLSVGAALLAVQGVLAALLARESSGHGQHVATSLYAAAFAMSTPVVGGSLRGEGHAWSRRPVGPSPFYGAFACADGKWLHFGCIHAEFVRRATEALGIAEEVRELARDPEFGNGVRIRSEPLREELFEVVGRAVRGRPYAEWASVLEEADVPFAPVRRPHEYFDDPQAQVNGIAEVEDPDAGTVRQIGQPVRLVDTPGDVRVGAPRLGEHTRGVLEDVARDAAADGARAGGELRRTHDLGHGAPPLAGLRVLEIGSLIAGPMAGRFLADLGADVVKLEPPDGGDIARRNGSPAFLPLSAGKRGIAVDLKRPEGREIGHRLASRADVVIENMRPGAAERLGMGWDELRALHPRLVYCHVTAYGSRGPYAHRPGLDPLAGALAGVETRQGGPAGKPAYLHFAAVDHAAALLACDGILMALLARERTGRGQRVETSLLDAAALLNADAISDPLPTSLGQSPRSARVLDLGAAAPRSARSGDDLVAAGLARPGDRADGDASSGPVPAKTQYGPHALHRLYETSAGWICVTAASDQQWRSLCRVLGLDELAWDARFAGASARAANDEALSALLECAFKERTAEAWLPALEVATIPCAPVVEDYEDRFHLDPEVVANDMVVEHEVAGLGAVRLPHRWLRFSITPTRRPFRPPLLGEHTRAVLAEIDYSEADIEALRERGVVAWEAAW